METAMVEELDTGDVDLIRGFVDDCRLRGYSPETIRSHRSNFRTIQRFLKRNGLGFQEVDKDALRRLLAYLKNTRRVGSKTVESYFSALSSFYEYLLFEDLVKANPVPGFRKRYLTSYKNRGPGPQRKLVSVEDMSRLINGTLEARDRARSGVM